MAYDFMIGMNMMYGITGSYRGGNGLYQGEVSQNVIETWGEFYNKYKDILGESVVHIAPPLATSDTSLTTDAIDGIIHVDSDGVQKGLAAFFNQTTETVTQTVKIPLYYTGLTGLSLIHIWNGNLIRINFRMALSIFHGALRTQDFEQGSGWSSR